MRTQLKNSAASDAVGNAIWLNSNAYGGHDTGNWKTRLMIDENGIELHLGKKSQWCFRCILGKNVNEHENLENKIAQGSQVVELENCNSNPVEKENNNDNELKTRLMIRLIFRCFNCWTNNIL